MPVRAVVENPRIREGRLEDDQVTAVRYDALGRAIETIADPDGADARGLRERHRRRAGL
jgi:hypothetical protein